MSLAKRLAEERRARLAAERLLELKQSELFAANRKLGMHAKKLSSKIVESRAEVEQVKGENRRVKTELGVAHEKVEIAERRMWHSIETIQDGFAYFDADNRLIAANKAYLAVFDGLEEVQQGISYARILQLLTEEGILNIGKERPSEWRARMLKRWEQDQPDPMEIQIWNGEHVRILDRRGPDGDVVSLAINITERVRYEAELEEARQKAEAANRAKSAFLANMSHEIRTPMNGVVGMADLLSESELNDDQRLYVETIKSSGDALLSLINDVLDFSKIEADKLVLNSKPFDLEKTIQDVARLLQPVALEKNLSLKMDYDLFLPTEFVGDPGRIRQIITNLMGNAIKFTPSGHVLLRVVGMAQDDGTYTLHVAVEDTGIGISKDKVAHVFGEFNQVDDDRNRQFEGTGLGLAITKRLVELMGGSMWVDSALGEGSCFGFRINLSTHASDTANAPRLPEGIDRVLVVDESNGSCGWIAGQYLQTAGVEIIRCGAPDLTQDLVQSCQAVLIVEGVQSADVFPVVDKLRSLGQGGRVVLITSNLRHPNRTAVDAVLQRPYQRTALFEALSRTSQTEPSNVPDRVKPLPVRSMNKTRVLVAEDNKTNQLVFRKMVGDLDLDLRFAGNGFEAVDAYLEERPDVIFMDISMPGMDGKEATKRIREIEDGDGSVPIIAVTAHALAGDKEAILAAGLNDYLTKPLRKAALLEKLEQYAPQYQTAV